MARPGRRARSLRGLYGLALALALVPAPAQGQTADSGAAGAAYRMPGSGQLVLTRPTALLEPPPQAPRSHLALTPSPAALAAVPETTERAAASAPSATPPAAPDERPSAAAPSAPAAAAEAPAAPETLAGAETPPAPAEVTAELQGDAGPPPPPEGVAAASPAAPETTPVVAPSPGAESRQSAVLPATGGIGEEERIAFAQGSAELSAAARSTLDDLALRMQSEASLRAQLLAYAADAGDGGSQARRLSLSRALAVRAYLIDRGVRSTRLDVRALGSNVPDGPPDRVDIVPQRSG
jgi:outer membrane protein OmpA-like peptidoglycan-associated protein